MIRERVPRDINGFPVFRKPHRESDELDASTGMLDDFDGPDSSDTVAFDEDSSPAYMLGRLETLQTVYRDSMPSGCKSALRKSIGLLQSLVTKSESTRRDMKAGIFRQLKESSPSVRKSISTPRASSSSSPPSLEGVSTATFAAWLR